MFCVLIDPVLLRTIPRPGEKTIRNPADSKTAHPKSPPIVTKTDRHKNGGGTEGNENSAMAAVEPFDARNWGRAGRSLGSKGLRSCRPGMPPVI